VFLSFLSQIGKKKEAKSHKIEFLTYGFWLINQKLYAQSNRLLESVLRGLMERPNNIKPPYSLKKP